MMNSKHINLSQIIADVMLFIGTVILFSIFTLKFIRVYQCDFPVELREINVVKMADEISKGINPYSLDKLEQQRPYVTNLYGILGSIWSGIFIKIFRWTQLSSLQIAQFSILLVEMVGCVFFYLALKKLSHKNTILEVWGTIVFCQCFYRLYPFEGAFPDGIGVAFQAFLIWKIAEDRQKQKYSPMLYAGCMIVLFFIKQYFVLVTFGVLVYLMINAKKSDVVKYIMTGVIGGVIVFSIVQLMFPLYFTESICMTSISTGLDNWRYSLGQVPMIWKRVLVFLVAICIYAMCKFNIKNILKEYCGIQLFCMFILSMYIAQNTGAALTYYLQLWTPYCICVGVQCIATIYDKPVKYKWMINSIFGISSLMTLVFIKGITYCGPVSDTIKNTWQENNIILNKYAAKGEILVNSGLSNFCLEEEIYTHDWGQGQFKGQGELDNYLQNKNMQLLFPHTKYILDSYINYEQIIQSKVRDGDYELIAITDDDYGITVQDIEMGGYVLLNEKNIVTGWEEQNISYYVRN